ncbi:transketolase [Thioalkalivibrio sp. HK1]|uniref:transketolase n=1 Tax=Thioalkalivibrio sp. HK1 TaxID=1469245 RepID=UPI000471CC03|nr:transketolase [Thioalkalivibrio sp. HK1]
MPTAKELADAIRVLSMDAVQQAGSGHPGMPMGMADIAQTLWCDHLRHDPAHSDWPDRDRFVLSNGHGSMLLYALLHLSGYDLPIDEIRRFRQLGSSTPGHPEYGDTPGVETTTGPLGQGLANAVGMAIAERALAARFNRKGHEIVDHRTWVFLGDGCLMEGISHEACSLAGTLGLGKLIGIYDDNAISIDGDVKGWFTDDTPKRFEAYGWHVIRDVDGHDAAAVSRAIAEAKAVSDRPSLLCCKTIIGFGSPGKQGDASAHGSPLGVEEVERARASLGWTHPPFEIPTDIYAAWDARPSGEKRYRDWCERFESYRAAFPEEAGEFERRMQGLLPRGWDAACEDALAAVDAAALSVASRKASLDALEALGPMLPELIGGSADLTGSNLTLWSGSEILSRDCPDGNYIHFGVREFAMSAIGTGLALHGGFIPYCATFLVFSEYARNALRMAALMGQRVIFVFTHDSIGLGEDGPTHQAVEQTATLRLIPGMSVWRPCDAVESMVAWQEALMRREGPTCLLFSRQGLSHQERSRKQVEDIKRGAHVLKEGSDALLIATGSEVGIAMSAAALLDAQGLSVQVVSMTSVDRFEAQDEAYRASVLPPSQRARVAVEAGIPHGWRAWTGEDGAVIGVSDFGKSAPWKDVYEYFGLTAEHVAAEVRRVIERLRSP